MCGISKPDHGWLQETVSASYSILFLSTTALSYSGHRIQNTEDDLKQMNDNLAAHVPKSGREFGLSPLAPLSHSATCIKLPLIHSVLMRLHLLSV